MKTIQSYEEWQIAIKKHDSLLLFVKTNHCSVCEGLFPQVKALKESDALPFYVLNISDVPEMAGQLSLFTAPVVLLYYKEKEYARFARFVPMEDLKYRMQELIDGREQRD
ncbi:thioredoxin family protein [Sporosarcina ureilytica]|uniref:Thiol reductase thioredoxin n=1 Tax=Sporosarcina ureilytica TaxID=298596 RepID=A0A1D8JGF9_9BACL|nr:thioredoxin family protein [Sporosarcina ureilytica]AOV07774.1 thiol reductase thioredoxin [Sporosarcina ureilytica]